MTKEMKNLIIILLLVSPLVAAILYTVNVLHDAYGNSEIDEYTYKSLEHTLNINCPDTKEFVKKLLSDGKITQNERHKFYSECKISGKKRAITKLMESSNGNF